MKNLRMYSLFTTLEDEQIENSKVVTTEIGNEFNLNECEYVIDTLLFFDPEYQALVHLTEMTEYLDSYHDIQANDNQTASEIACQTLGFELASFSDYAEIKEYEVA